MGVAPAVYENAIAGVPVAEAENVRLALHWLGAATAV